MHGAEKSFSEKLAMFQTGVGSGAKIRTEKFYAEDAGLVTNQARRFVLEQTGADASIEEAYKQQEALLMQFSAQRQAQSQDDLFAKAYSAALDAGLNDEEALSQATAMMSFKS